MIELVLGPQALGSVAFAFSPLAEVATSLRLLDAPQPHYVNLPWLQAVRARLTSLDLGLLRAIAPAGPWVADFFFPLPSGPADLPGQLADLLTVPPERLRADLEKVWSDRPMPRAARELHDDPVRGVELIAEAVWAYWDAALAPFWPRMRGVLEDDIAYRAARSVASGLVDLLAGLHSDVTIADHRVRIDLPGHPDAVLPSSSLVLIPSVFVWPRLVLAHYAAADLPHRSDGDAFSLTYAARGVGRLWDPSSGDGTEDHLAALLGRTRARILAALSVPCSTTSLARSLGQSPGSVSMHLTVLCNGGLVDRRRAGRSVLYRQTALGTSVVSVSRTSADRWTRQSRSE
jgi:DNA-binding transcriptional ArsR family regulator